ncbi:protein argonaute 4b, partial [Phtheirospermum japonicum]
GTSRPAHYHVLFDEIGFPPDDLHKLVFEKKTIGHAYGLFCIAVAPVCYAHLAAKQMGQFLKFDDQSETSSEQKSMTTSGSICVPQLPRLHKDVAGSMFFC